MAHIAQHVLQYDVLYGACAILLSSFVPTRDYWQPTSHPPLHPDQRAVIITVTKTATVTPTSTTIKTIVPKTIYDTVTKQVTSVSVDRHYLTKYTHYPIDSATPCITHTHTYSFSPASTPMWNATPANDVYPVTTTAKLPMGRNAWVLLALLIVATIWLLRYFKPEPINDELDELAYNLTLMERRLLAEQKRHTETQEIANKLKAKLEQTMKDNATLAFRVKVSNILFQKLAVYDEGGDEPDNETLAKMVETRIEALLALREEIEKQAQIIRLLVAAAPKLEAEIQKRWNREWQGRLDQKQMHVDHWRHYFAQNATDAMKEMVLLREENAALKKRLDG